MNEIKENIEKFSDAYPCILIYKIINNHIFLQIMILLLKKNHSTLKKN